MHRRSVHVLALAGVLLSSVSCGKPEPASFDRLEMRMGIEPAGAVSIGTDGNGYLRKTAVRSKDEPFHLTKAEAAAVFQSVKPYLQQAHRPAAEDTERLGNGLCSNGSRPDASDAGYVYFRWSGGDGEERIYWANFNCDSLGREAEYQALSSVANSLWSEALKAR